MGYTSKETRKKYYWKNRTKVRAQQNRLYPKHREKIIEGARLYRQRNPESYRRASLKRKYGLTIEDYNRMYEAQGGVCGICKQPETTVMRGKVVNLSIDHNHQTNKVRALLCTNCNIGIGNFKDSPLLLRAAAEYLDEHFGH